jgi:iron complex outermembrane recepter protein
MSHRREKRARQTARLALTTVVSSGALILAPALKAQQTATQSSSTSTAGEASKDSLQEVVVTGYRAALQSALDSKRKSDLPIESVAAEDLGKMPDQNVAESLQRLPGVQIDRAQGQGTAVLIDGLRQNLTTLNGDIFLTGKEFYVSGEASGGGAGGNAQYSSLEGIPSEEIGGIDVIKNPSAAITEGGLGGTINLKTRDPLAQPEGLTIGGNFRESYGQGSGQWTPVGALVGSFKLNDRVAFQGSVSYDDEKTHTKEFEAANRSQWLISSSATSPYVGPLTPAGLTTLPNGQLYTEPQLAYFSDIDDRRKILGATFGVTAQVTDAIRSSVRWFHSREQDTTLTYSDKAWFNGAGATPATPPKAQTLIPGIDPTLPYSIDGNGVVQNGTFNANGAETATLYQQNVSNANNYQFVTSFDDGGPLRGDLGLSYAKANSDLQASQADVEHGLYLTSAKVATSPAAPGCNNGASTCAGAGNHGYEFAYANGGTSGLPSVSYLAPYADVLTNPGYTTFKSNWAWANTTNQRQFAVKANIQFDPAFIKDVPSTLSTGVRYAGRDIDQTFGRYLINGTLPDGSVAGNTSDPNGGPYLYYQDPGYGTPNIPYSTAVSNPGLAKLVNNFAVGNIVVKDPVSGGMTHPGSYLQQVWAGAGVPNMTEQLFVDGLSSFSVRERTTAVYLMGDIGGAENHFHMNFGVRFVDTDLTIDNGQSAQVPTYYGTAPWNGVDSNVIPNQVKRNYTDVLPTFNFVLDVTESQKVRFGAARVVAPQDLFLLGLGNSYNFTRETNNRTNIHTGKADGFAFDGGSAGNAQLDPYRASQFNVSYENYFAQNGLVSVAGFYKQVDNFVIISNVPTTVQDDFGGTQRTVKEPLNAGKGRIYGFELGGQYAFGSDLLPWLNGAGVAANYTRSISSSDQVTSFSMRAPIPGVSKDSVTGTVYYERFGFSARASYSWQGKSVSDSVYGSTLQFNDQNNVSKVYQIFAAPYGQLDAQIGYDFDTHFGVLASAQNLTNAAQHTYLQWPNQPLTYDQWGRRFFVGFKFKN